MRNGGEGGRGHEQEKCLTGGYKKQCCAPRKKREKVGNRLLLPDDLKAESRISKGISQGEKKRKEKLIFDLQKRRGKD